eukprot:32786_1
MATLHATRCTVKIYENQNKLQEWFNFYPDYASDPEENSAYVGSITSPYSMYGPDELYVTDNRGFAGIVLGLADDLMSNGIEIKLNEPVININYQDEEIVSVKTENGNEYCATKIIVTFSMGVLQSDLVEFEPELPQWKQDIFNDFNPIAYAGIYIAWPYDFWSNYSNLTTQTLYFMDDKKGYFVFVHNYNNINLLPGSNIWRVDVTDSLAHRVRKQSEQETIDELVNDKFAKYFDFPIPKPLHIFISNWSNNKYIKACWAQWAPGFAFNNFDDIKANVDKKIFFGGEYTSFGSWGLVTGAYLEGIRAAEDVIGCLNEILDDQSIFSSSCDDSMRDNEENSLFFNYAKSVIMRIGTVYNILILVIIGLFLCWFLSDYVGVSQTKYIYTSIDSK